MATHNLDALGLKCPQPVLKVAILARQLVPGDLLDIMADCESFPVDIEKWCKTTGKTLLFCADEGDGKVHAQIQF